MGQVIILSLFSVLLRREHENDQKSVRHTNNHNNAETVTDEDARECINRMKDKPDGYIS